MLTCGLKKINPINLLMLKLEYRNQSFTENYADRSVGVTEKGNNVQASEKEDKDKDEENPHITGNEISKNLMKIKDKIRKVCLRQFS